MILDKKKRYTLEVQSCVEVVVIAESPEEARIKLIEDKNIWSDILIDDATISNPIREERIIKDWRR